MIHFCRKWQQIIFIVYKGKSFFGVSNDGDFLVCHHFVSWLSAPHLRYGPLNDVLLKKKIRYESHKCFLPTEQSNKEAI